MNSIARLFRVSALFFVALVTAPSSFASSGWYLLSPTISDFNEHAKYLQSYKILDSKPLSQWRQEGAYDSASECEADKNTLLVRGRSFYSKTSEDYIKAVGAKMDMDSPALKHMRLAAEMANVSVDAWATSRCIKSDDSRLGK